MSGLGGEGEGRLRCSVGVGRCSRLAVMAPALSFGRLPAQPGDHVRRNRGRPAYVMEECD